MNNFENTDEKYKYYFDNPTEFRIYRFPSFEYYCLFEYISGFCMVMENPMDEVYVIEKMIKLGTLIVDSLDKVAHPNARHGNSKVIDVVETPEDLIKHGMEKPQLGVD
ncbi:hypothetical protein Fleli_0334 [Bernardetia litoralis DSM 6794]|uniref:Uncharacterized protein n=1 Tax=Bernardetia litoralis (strain ATCC 23117 / DSM 6794 / NBRC 15988 / NCIMB 1366 / Fx l1 / Sio-4) TaxID=880071 RepID=I4AFT3_BERLS|nr:hypothetical protein [Bernardetia litoralis]AFM02818.1 hypothetical protein Fleli_0334 [Bernardetia litoralis DSM 6794]